jgi:hypothetical protein
VGLALLAVVLAGCGGGRRVTEARSVAAFDRIVVSGGLEIEVAPGDGRGVRVRAGEHVIDRVVTESSGGVLRLGLRDRGIVIGPDPLGDARVRVAAGTLRGVTIDGTGSVRLRGLDEPALDLTVQGAGDIEASGTVDRLTAEIEGAGDADLAALSTRTASVTVQGAGDADLAVSESLEVTVQGAGDVSYRGDPQVRSVIQGAGDLDRVGP